MLPRKRCGLSAQKIKLCGHAESPVHSLRRPQTCATSSYDTGIWLVFTGRTQPFEAIRMAFDIRPRQHLLSRRARVVRTRLPRRHKYGPGRSFRVRIFRLDRIFLWVDTV